MRHISVMIFVGLVGGSLPNFLSTSLKKAEEISRLSGEIHIAFYLFFIPFPAKKTTKKQFQLILSLAAAPLLLPRALLAQNHLMNNELVNHT